MEPELCSYCGLPVAGSRRPATTAISYNLYCCSGCRLADAIMAEQQLTGTAQKTLIRVGLAIFFTMNVMVFSLALWSRHVYPNDESATARSWDELFRYASCLFTVPVVFLLTGPLMESAWDGLCRRRLTTDLLLLVGVIASFLYSVVVTWMGDGQIYFEVTCVLLVAVTIGRWLEAMSRYRATTVVASLQSLLPNQARVVRDGETQFTALSDVPMGSLLRILPNERIPLDGKVERYAGAVDEQIMTGESVPREKQPGDAVFGGTRNLQSELWVRVTETCETGTLSRMVASMRQAIMEKSPRQELADRCVEALVPIVALIALAAAIYHAHYHGIGEGIMIALSVILIACPCALAIATPMANWMAMSLAMQRGVFFRYGAAIPQLAKVTLIAFDKTGTLTDGVVRFNDCKVATSATEAEVWGIAVELARSSNHPLARGLVGERCSWPPSAPALLPSIARDLLVTEYPGRGVIGRSAAGHDFVLGSQRFLRERGLSLPAEWSDETGKMQNPSSTSMLYVGWDGNIQGQFSFMEELRATALPAIQSLQSMGIACHMMTGDQRGRADEVANALGIRHVAELLPSEKLKQLRAWRGEGKFVAMVGDGVNDAPALAAADVGIALASGADISRDAAGVCLLHDNLNSIPWSIQLARATVRTMRRNLVWAFAYNIVGVGLAAVGWLNPIVAAIAMTGSSLMVVGDSLRLSRRVGQPTVAEQQAVDDFPTLEKHRRESALASRLTEEVCT